VTQLVRAHATPDHKLLVQRKDLKVRNSFSVFDCELLLLHVEQSRRPLVYQQLILQLSKRRSMHGVGN